MISRQGAKLELAENKDLLFQEYNFLSKINNSISEEDKLIAYLDYKKSSDKLLSDRDDYIASQINKTLKDGEVGVAFFGSIHSIINKLGKDIRVEIMEMFSDEISINLSRR